MKKIFNRDDSLKQRQEKIISWNLKHKKFDKLFKINFDSDRASKTNCENLIGSVEIPVGATGPVIYHSDDGEKKEALIPLATSEGALIASVSRGIRAINEAQGAEVFSKRIGMSRAPVFDFKSGKKAFDFEKFIKKEKNLAKIKEISENSSSHLKFKHLQSWVRGRKVYLRFVFDTDQAMGMNMVTIALKEVWDQFLSQYEEIEMLAISGNLCVDKKSSVANTLFGRGDYAHAEVFLTKEVVESVLKSSVEKIVQTHVAKNLVGSNLAGSFAQNMQAANVVAAFFLATGQDMAHVLEASQVTTSFEVDGENLYAAVDMPNINMGTIGGGTWLEAQKEARSLISQNKELTSIELAEVLAVAVLAAEISGMAALSSKSLAKAHNDLARVKKIKNA